MNTDKQFFLENLGCAKNQVDAEVMIGALQAEGWKMSDAPDNAKLIIVNTCGFIEPAKKESIDVLISYRDAYPDAVVIAAGCLSERYSADLAESMPELDGIFGNMSLSRITEFVEKQAETKEQLVLVPTLEDVSTDESGRDDIFSINRTVLLSGPSSAYVKLAEGCSNNCSFCAIPVIRGPLRSRTPESVVDEVRHLSESGLREINLIAQDLGSYGVDLEAGGKGVCLLADLLTAIDQLPGDFIVRMLYIHPDNFPLEILDICAKSSRILSYFDIPFQHASTDILASMNRRGNAEKHLKLLGEIRAKLPDAVIRTTFLCGFPGEGKADVQQLEKFISEARLEWAGFFSYSREEDTPAFNMETERKHNAKLKAVGKTVEALQQLQSSVTTEAFGRFIGKTLSLLVEEGVEKEDLYLCRAWFQAPEVDGLVVLHAEEGSLMPGTFVEADITAVNGIDLEAVLRG